MVSTRELKFRRRRQGKTNYAKRLALLKSGKTRIVFRKSNRFVSVQFVEFGKRGDKTVVGVNSKQLNKFGWLGNANIPSSYLTGFLAGKLALEKGIKSAVLDIGLITPALKSMPFAALQGALDAGIEIPHDDSALPEKGRIEGKHIEAFAQSLGGEERKKRFSEYSKKGIDVGKLSEAFAKAKERIEKEAGVK